MPATRSKNKGELSFAPVTVRRTNRIAVLTRLWAEAWIRKYFQTPTQNNARTYLYSRRI